MSELAFTAFVVLSLLGSFSLLLVCVLLWRGGRSSQTDTGLLDVLETMGYSLQCVNGQWAVTLGGQTVIGQPQATPRRAILSAAGWLVEEKANG